MITLVKGLPPPPILAHVREAQNATGCKTLSALAGRMNLTRGQIQGWLDGQAIPNMDRFYFLRVLAGVRDVKRVAAERQHMLDYREKFRRFPHRQRALYSDQRKMRPCLRCRADFVSEWIGNRICATCTKTVDDMPDELRREGSGGGATSTVRLGDSWLGRDN